MDLLFHILFFIFSLYVLLKTIYYGIYELKTQNNKVGGIGVICFSVLVTIFTNLVVFMK